MKIDCLMGTCGRYTTACEALACFLQQTVLSQATLLIYNQHTIPLHFDHPRVRVINERPPKGSLRYVRQRMHELADPDADLVHWWDDDDLYLPWHLEDCLENVGEAVAWKPASSWFSKKNVEFSRAKNTFEGSWVFRADYLKRSPIDTHPTDTDHPVTMQTIDSGRLATTELGGRASYIYRWGNSVEHVSMVAGGNLPELKQRAVLAHVRLRSGDIREDGRLIPADLISRWDQFLSGTKNLVSQQEWEMNRAILSRQTSEANCE